jgi:hypothetical protein
MSELCSGSTTKLKRYQIARKRAVVDTRNKIRKLHIRLATLISECNHVTVRCGDGAKCLVCGKNFGWWCPNSPTHYCEYDDEFNESCKYCEEPEERK